MRKTLRAFLMVMIAAAAGGPMAHAQLTPDRAEREIVHLQVTGNHIDAVREVVTDTLTAWYEVSESKGDHVLRLHCSYTVRGRKSKENPFEHTCILTGSFRDLRFEVSESHNANKRDVWFRFLITESFADILSKIRTAYPMMSRVLLVEGERVVIDMGKNVGLTPGRRLVVLSEDEERLAILSVETVREKECEARVVWGEGKFQEGDVVRERAWLKGNLQLVYATFPVKIETSNPLFLDSMDEPKRFTEGRSYHFVFSMVDKTETSGGVGQLFAWSLSTGLLDFSAVKVWEILHVDLGLILELVPERILLELGGGGGIGIGSSLSWRRPPGDYDDKIERDSGRAENWVGMWYGDYSVSARGHLFIGRTTSLFGGIGYTRYHKFRGLTDTKEPTEEKGGYRVNEDWLEFDFQRMGGRRIEIGLSFWVEGL